jgi:restriction endonuclease S subunit
MTGIISDYQHLSFIDSKNFVLWNIGAYLQSDSSSFNFAFSPMSFFVSKKKESASIEPGHSYNQLKVKLYGKGIVLRKKELGKNIKSKQFYAQRGDLVFSKIDARNGAFGIVPEHLDGAVVTNDFPVYSIDYQKIVPEYLNLVLSSKWFVSICQSKSSGTTGRQRISNDIFENLQIPLPTLEVQQKIVDDYNSKVNRAIELEQEATELEQSIDEYLKDELGINLENKLHGNNREAKILQLVDFKQFKRWDTNFLKQKYFQFQSSYNLIPLKEMISSLRNGIAGRDFSEKGVTYLRVGNIRNNRIIDKDIKRTNNYLEKDLLNKGTLLITRKGTVGESTVVKESNNFVASSEIFIIELKKKILDIDILPEYVSVVNQSSFLKSQYKDRFTGAFMPSLSQDKLKELLYPIPPIHIQSNIINHINNLRNKIAHLGKKSTEAFRLSLSDFEKEVFNT